MMRAAGHHGKHPDNRAMPGFAYALLAYVIWGLFPLYFRQLERVPPLDIVLHRSVWLLVCIALLLAATRRIAWLGKALRQPRLLALFAFSALLLAGNWLLYVWAVNSHRVVDASLGYFINPLVNVLLGAAVLHERLRRAQWLAVTLAALGVLWLTLQAGQLPWIALLLAVSFGVYGLLRKTAPLGALEGLALETLLLTPVVLPLLVAHTLAGGITPASDPVRFAWLLLAGPLTALTLLLFAAGARRLPMTTLGLLQYVSPTLQFALGVGLYHEPFDRARGLGFALIWAALALYAFEGWLFTRAVRPAAASG